MMLEDKIFFNEEKGIDGITGWKAIEAELVDANNQPTTSKSSHLLKGILGKAGQDMSSDF